MEQSRGHRILRVVIPALSIILLTVFTGLCARWVMSLRDPARLAAFQTWIDTLGPGGWIVLFGIQYVQIVVALIPGGPVQIVAGALFGAWGGLVICLTGTIAATATVFGLVQRFGHGAIALLVDKKDTVRYRFLNDEKKLSRFVLILFFIPGTPKDALTYLFALTRMPFSRFIVLSMAARLPAMLTSLFAGESIVEGEWLHALILFCIITCVSAAGLFLHYKILRRRRSG